MEKVLVGLSGGVDSAVSCYILKKAGYDVTALTLITYETDAQKKDLEDAKNICKKLNIKHIIKDVRKEFEKEVISYFVKEYENGRTPNPCCKCNKDLKMNTLLNTMKEMQFDFYATGHYAKVCKVKTIDGERYAIKVAGCEAKDQAYMLYKLTQDQIKNLLLPLSYLGKDDVRNIARKIGLDVSEKKDSLDVCFIKNIDYKEFIKQYEFGKNYKEKIATGDAKLLNKMNEALFLKRGQFVDTNNNILGYHNGIINYTVGQRKGLNIALSKRAYVVDVDSTNLKVVLGDDKDLFQNVLFVKDYNFQAISDLNEGDYIKNVLCKIRYKDKGEICTVIKENNELKIEFKNPVRAITKGQSAVFYYKDVILGGGIII